MLLDNSYSNMDTVSFWQEKLANTRALLDKVEQAIYSLTQNEVTEYTLDTGQNRQTVKRQDLGSLHLQRERLLSEIDQLERKLGLHGSAARQIVPGY
ncbi:MAG: hypothetical protein MJZ37_07430 [Bacilli bacterium]|nr:hypothetical protein [Bacilli bacterium]